MRLEFPAILEVDDSRFYFPFSAFMLSNYVFSVFYVVNEVTLTLHFAPFSFASVQLYAE